MSAFQHDEFQALGQLLARLRRRLWSNSTRPEITVASALGL